MHNYKFESFTTLCELHIDAENKKFADYVAHVILLETKRLEKKYSFFDKDSDLYKINHRLNNDVFLDDEFVSLVKLSLFYYEKTLGAFDVVIDGSIKLEENRIIFSNENAKIDFGGLVKEYAVDSAIALLKDFNVNSALVNFGGDLATIGSYHGEKWNIGIENPKNEAENILTVFVEDCALCTSAHTKRYKNINDKKESHIIVKEKNDYQQISIMAPTTVDAGVWSTALLSKPSLRPPSHIKIIKLL